MFLEFVFVPLLAGLAVIPSQETRNPFLLRVHKRCSTDFLTKARKKVIQGQNMSFTKAAVLKKVTTTELNNNLFSSINWLI